MPHDANGARISVGDKVLIEGRVTHINEGEDYCNCTVELLHRMPPDMTVTTVSAINTKQVVKQGS